MRDRVVDLIRGVEVERTTAGLQDLYFRLSHRAFPGIEPHPIVYHVEQVAVVADELLCLTDPMEREWGRRYAIAHDIGRAVDMGPQHTEAGARILREYGFGHSLVTYALAHHRWGLGVPVLIEDKFPEKVSHALENGTISHIIDSIVGARGLAALAVLLADNSKRPIAPEALETEIYPFDLTHADTLINIQIARGRYERGSDKYEVDKIGARFLYTVIPHLEKLLGVRYAPDGSGNDVITRASARWPAAKEAVLAKWQKIHYGEAHK